VAAATLHYGRTFSHDSINGEDSLLATDSAPSETLSGRDEEAASGGPPQLPDSAIRNLGVRFFSWRSLSPDCERVGRTRAAVDSL